MNTYSIPKPTLSAIAYGLAVLLGIGLIGLGIAAFEAFNYMARPVQAFAFALVIELGMIWEAISIIRRNWFAIPGLVISLLVSGLYNFTQAAQAGAILSHPITNPVQLAALSIGPLSAVFFMALSFGLELRAHDAATLKWQKARQAWLDERETQRVQAEKEAALRQNEAALAAQRLHLEAEQRRADLVHEEELARIAALAEEQKRATRAQQRAIARAERTAALHSSADALSHSATHSAAVQNVVRSGADAPVDAPEESADAPLIITRATYQDFASAQRARNGAGPMTYKEVMETFQVKRRTAFEWLATYRGNDEVNHETNE